MQPLEAINTSTNHIAVYFITPTTTETHLFYQIVKRSSEIIIELIVISYKFSVEYDVIGCRKTGKFRSNRMEF